jgi:hypothetical protein
MVRGKPAAEKHTEKQPPDPYSNAQNPAHLAWCGLHIGTYKNRTLGGSAGVGPCLPLRFITEPIRWVRRSQACFELKAQTQTSCLLLAVWQPSRRMHRQLAKLLTPCSASLSCRRRLNNRCGGASGWAEVLSEKATHHASCLLSTWLQVDDLSVDDLLEPGPAEILAATTYEVEHRSAPQASDVSRRICNPFCCMIFGDHEPDTGPTDSTCTSAGGLAALVHPAGAGGRAQAQGAAPAHPCTCQCQCSSGHVTQCSSST